MLHLDKNCVLLIILVFLPSNSSLKPYRGRVARLKSSDLYNKPVGYLWTDSRVLVAAVCVEVSDEFQLFL
jgi:hypothetical protein